MLGFYWQPSETPPSLAQVQAAFRSELGARAGRMLPAIATSSEAPQLGPALAAGIASFRAFRFTEAVRQLGELERAVEATGGGGLDPKQLSDLYLYRGLCRLESNDSEGAWADLVRSARLDPSRTLDPAQIPPRALQTFRRAAAEVAQQPRGEVALRVPEGATVLIDGRTHRGTATLGLGRHLVRVEAPGYEPFIGALTVESDHETFEPSLQAKAPPQLDALVERLHAEGNHRDTLLFAALRRSGPAWRLAVRVVELSTGAVRGEELSVEGKDVGATLHELVPRLLEPNRLTAPVVIQPPPPKKRSLAWLWGLGAGVAAAITVAVPLGVVYGRASRSGVVGGSLERLP